MTNFLVLYWSELNRPPKHKIVGALNKSEALQIVTTQDFHIEKMRVFDMDEVAKRMAEYD